jgi:hypothetical protein
MPTGASATLDPLGGVAQPGRVLHPRVHVLLHEVAHYGDLTTILAARARADDAIGHEDPPPSSGNGFAKPMTGEKWR